MKSDKKYTLDRTAFTIHSFEKADDAMRNYLDDTVKERLEIAYYLTSIAYRFDMLQPPRLDKSAFHIRQLDA